MSKSKLYFFILVCFSIQAAAQNIVVNELVAKNETGLEDSDGDFGDWIELYNPTTTEINLENYGISDDINDLEKWIFPSVTIPPHGFIVVFASGKNRYDTSELHTNFSISSSGESLILTNPQGIILDQSTIVELTSNQSLLRIPDGSLNWEITDNPSPLASNSNSNRLILSHQEGFYTDPFSLSVHGFTADTIYYTTNGDIPTNQSAFITESIFIDTRENDPNVFSDIPTSPLQSDIFHKAWESPSSNIEKATILRFASFRNGFQTSNVYTKTYFVADGIYTKHAIPVISLVTEGSNFFNPDSGIYVPGNLFDTTDPLNTGNYYQEGEEWERDVHITYFDQEGNVGLSQNAGIRIHGRLTRTAAQKSLKLYAKSKYGEKYFNYKLLPAKDLDKYKQILLRSSMSASWAGNSTLQNSTAQILSRNLNLDVPDVQPVAVYLNGEYWGMHTMQDKVGERFIAYTHGLDEDSIEIKENWDWNTDYNEMIAFINANDLADNSNYLHIASKIDIENFIDYNIAEQFFRNYDWPGNNNKLWRALPNGKWRWIFYDIDAGFEDPAYNMLVHATLNDPNVTWPNYPESTFLFRNLLRNESFQRDFIQRYSEVLCRDFVEYNTEDKIDSIKALHKPEIAAHSNRWNYPISEAHWESDVDAMLVSFLMERPELVRKNISEFFQLSEYNFDCPSPYDEGRKMVVFPNPSNGTFQLVNNFSDQENLTLIIYNTGGRLIYSESNFSLSRLESKHFNLPHLTPGTYILHLSSEDINAHEKLVIVH